MVQQLEVFRTNSFRKTEGWWHEFCSR